jgi:hypothetical protein
MNKSLLISTALGAAALVVAGPAAAVSSATATLTGFSITLFDLDPSDGIDPELTFTYEQSGSYAYVQSSSESASDSDWQPGNFVPTSAMAMLAFGQANASTDASSANASGSVSGPGYGGQGYFGAYAYGVDNGFTLTPWTGIKLTSTFEGTASTGPSSGGDYAYATGFLQTSIAGDNGWEDHTAYRQAYAGCGTWDGMACSGESSSFSGTFSLGYANFSDDAVEGYMYAEAYVYGSSTVPVPEPETYLMLLAGLAGVGAVVRRRRAG